MPHDAGEVRARLAGLESRYLVGSRHNAGLVPPTRVFAVTDEGRRKVAHLISASQVREALALLGWTPRRLATSALVTFSEASAAQDDVAIYGLIRMALDAAGGRSGS